MTNPTKIVDFKLPLPWLVGSAIATVLFMVTIGWNASSASSKLDTLVKANERMEKRLDDRDGRFDGLRDTVSELRRTTDLNTLRISNLEGSRK